MNNSSDKEAKELNKSKDHSQTEPSKNSDQVSSASAQDVSLSIEGEISQNSQQVCLTSAQTTPLNTVSDSSSLSSITDLLKSHVQSSISLDDENVNITLSFPKSYFKKIYLLALEGNLSISKPELEEMRSITNNTEQCSSAIDRMEGTSCISTGFTEDTKACEENAANSSKTSEVDVCNKGNLEEMDKSRTFDAVIECEISSEQSIVADITSECLKGKASSNKDSDKSQLAVTAAETQCFDTDIRNEKDVQNDANLLINSDSQTGAAQSDNTVSSSVTTSMECESPFASAEIANNENELNISVIDKTVQNSDEYVCSIPSEVDQNESANFVSNEVEVRTSILEVNSETGESCEKTSSETLSNSSSDDISGFQIKEQKSAAISSKKHEVFNTFKAGEKCNLEVKNSDENVNSRYSAHSHTHSLNSSDEQFTDISKSPSTPKDNLKNTSNLSREFQSVLLASHYNYEIRDSGSLRLPSTNEITLVPTKEINTASQSSVKYFELDLPEHFVFVKITSREGDISIDAAKYKKEINTSEDNLQTQQREFNRSLSIENGGNESEGRNEHREAEEARSEVTETKPQISTEGAVNLDEMANNLRRNICRDLLNLHPSRNNLNLESQPVFGRNILSQMGIRLDCDLPGILPCVPHSDNDSSIEMDSSDKNTSLEVNTSDSTNDVEIIEADSVKQLSTITIDIDSVTEVRAEDCVADSSTSNCEFVSSQTVKEMSVDTISEVTESKNITDSKNSSKGEVVSVAQDSTVVESVKTDSKTVVDDETSDISKQTTEGATSPGDSKNVTEDEIFGKISEQATEDETFPDDSKGVRESETASGDSEQVTEGTTRNSEQVTKGQTVFGDSDQVTEGTSPDDSEQVMEAEAGSKHCEKIITTDVKDSVATEDIIPVENTERIIKVITDIDNAEVTVIEKKMIEDSVAKDSRKESITNSSDVDTMENAEKSQESESTGWKRVGIASEDSKVLQDNDVKIKVFKKENKDTIEDSPEEEENKEVTVEDSPEEEENKVTVEDSPEEEENKEVTIEDSPEEEENNRGNDSKPVREDSMDSEGNATEISNTAENLESADKVQNFEQVDVDTSTAMEEMENTESSRNTPRESSNAENSENISEYLANVADDPLKELSDTESETDTPDWVLKVSQTEDNERLELTTDEEDKLLELSTESAADQLDVTRTDVSRVAADEASTKHSAEVTKTPKNTSEIFDDSSNAISWAEKESDSISIKDVEDKYINKDRIQRRNPRTDTTIKHMKNPAEKLEKEIESISSEIISNDETYILHCSEAKNEEIQSKHGSSAASSDSDKANEESEEELYELYQVNKSQNNESIKEEITESNQIVSVGKSGFSEGMNEISDVAEKSASDPNESSSESVVTESDLHTSEQKDETCDEEAGEVSADESLKDVTEKPICNDSGNLREPTSTERKNEDLITSSKTEDTPISSLEIGDSAHKTGSKNSNDSIDQSIDVVDSAPTRVRGKKFPAPPLSQEVIPEDKDGNSKSKGSSKGDSQSKDTSVRSKSPLKRSLRSRSQELTANTSLSASKMTSRIKPNEDLEISRESSIEREKVATRKKREGTPDIKIKERVTAGVRSSPRKTTLKAAADSSSLTASKIELSTSHNTRNSNQTPLETRSTKSRQVLNTSTASVSNKKPRRGSKEK